MARIKGQGTILAVEATYNSGTFATVSQRTTISPNEATRAKLETTDLDSEAEESESGILREGENTFTINYDPETATHATLWACKGDGNKRKWRLDLVQGSRFAFEAWVSGFQVGELTTDKLVQATLKLQITGLVVLTP